MSKFKFNAHQSSAGYPNNLAYVYIRGIVLSFDDNEQILGAGETPVKKNVFQDLRDDIYTKSCMFSFSKEATQEQIDFVKFVMGRLEEKGIAFDIEPTSQIGDFIKKIRSGQLVTSPLPSNPTMPSERSETAANSSRGKSASEDYKIRIRAATPAPEDEALTNHPKK